MKMRSWRRYAPSRSLEPDWMSCRLNRSTPIARCSKRIASWSHPMLLGIQKRPSSTCARAPPKKLCVSSAVNRRAHQLTKFQRQKQTSLGVFRTMSHPLFDLSGRVAFVSGAASGMGKQMSIGFAESGADVVLADINSVGAQETAHEIEKLGRRAIP